jgi:hypothetical protein
MKGIHKSAENNQKGEGHSSIQDKQPKRLGHSQIPMKQPKTKGHSTIRMEKQQQKRQNVKHSQKTDYGWAFSTHQVPNKPKG